MSAQEFGREVAFRLILAVALSAQILLMLLVLKFGWSVLLHDTVATAREIFWATWFNAQAQFQQVTGLLS